MRCADARAMIGRGITRAARGFILLSATLSFSPVRAAPSELQSGGPATTGKLVLVENGVSRAPIVVFAGAPPMTRQAADELAEYIEKISGTRPKVIEGGA